MHNDISGAICDSCGNPATKVAFPDEPARRFYICDDEHCTEGAETVTDAPAMPETKQAEAERIQAENAARVSSPEYKRAERSVSRAERSTRRNDGYRD